jgi:WD repeat-containing protein 68
MWIPDKGCTKRDLLATTGDYLRLWSCEDNTIKMDKLLNSVRATLFSFFLW